MAEMNLEEAGSEWLIDHAVNILRADMESAIRDWTEIWSRMGFKNADIQNKMSLMINSVKDVLKHMTSQEKGLYDAAVHSIEANGDLLRRLQADLNQELVDLDQPRAIIEAEEIYRRAVTVLQKEKEMRLAKAHDLCQCLALINYRLGDGEPMASYGGSIPNTSDFEKLQLEVETKKKILETRIQAYEILAGNILELSKEMNYDCQSSLESSVLTGTQPAVLSSDVMARVSKLYEEMQRKHASCLEELEFTNQLKLTEINRLYHLCRIAQNERDAFFAIVPDKRSSKAAHTLDGEVKRLNHYYNEHREILNKTSQWEQALKRKIQLEFLCTDPSRLVNRGGVLLQVEKERKQVERNLNRLQHDIEAKVRAFDESRPESPLILNGMPVLQFLEETERVMRFEDTQARLEQMQKTRCPRAKRSSFTSSMKVEKTRNTSNKAHSVHSDLQQTFTKH